MEIQEIKSDLINFSSKIDFYLKMRLFLVKTTGINKNLIYSLEADKNTFKELLDNTIEQVNSMISSGKNQSPYDLKYSEKNSHVIFDTENFPETKEVINAFSKEENISNSIDRDDLKNIDLYLIEIPVSDSKIFKFIGRFDSMFALRRRFIFANYSNSELDLKPSDKLVGFNTKIEMVIVNNENVLINGAEAKFDSFFKMKKIITKKGQLILKDSDNFKQIFSTDTLDILGKYISTKKRSCIRIIKINSDEHRFQKTIENILKIESIINNPNHEFYEKIKNVKIDTSGNSPQLYVEDDSYREQLINAISDAMYQAIISEVNSVDNSRL